MDPTTLAAGDRVGRYIIDAPIGQGGMGVVYSAQEPELERAVAVKLLRPELVSERARTRMAREARLMAKLSHPNVVTVHDVGRDEIGDFIVMELVDGVDLRR